MYQIKENSDDDNTLAVGQAKADTSCSRSIKSYEAPVLICYGDVRDITLGGTIGFGESGAGFEFTDNLPPP